MKKLILIFMIVFGITSAAQSQVFRKKINIQTAKYVAPVGNFNLIFLDIDGQMDVHDTMQKIDNEYNPTLIIIKDEEKDIWRLAKTLEEASRMPDEVTVVSVKFKQTLPYKRTGYN